MSSAEASSSKLPPIQKGASLMIAYRLEDRPVLLIGGGVVAAGRLFFLLEAGARVTLVSPPPLHPDISERLSTNPHDITWHSRSFDPVNDDIHVQDFAMVLTAIDEVEISRQICDLCREHRVPVNVADIPPSCDFYFGAQLRRGPLQIMVSTGGSGPKIGAMVRDIVDRALPENLEEAIEGVGLLRGDLRVRAQGVGGSIGRRRMQWMIGICDAWGLESMAKLRDETVRKAVLDHGWEGDRVVRPSDVGLREEKNRRRRLIDWSYAGWYAAGLGGMVTGMTLGMVGTIWMLKRPSR
ncbi:putative NAD(P)-binding-domain-containing protein [Kockovaella imperatae]|uniref:precorrin-2 dehydrogenase n=1 Tax=Kockovaella imperatae TaxID=4999 RepID=A0A1Y1UNZ9_9TREE|nr:putative NAD(P)-binding-domain-containing protein [Kockovaella imperatae]ORX39196.1 putative NAD(P)-binding-domain-containing protein [Kockovaella imperatae]